MTAETLRVCLLGDVQVLSGDEPVSLSGAQRLGLLALLALRAPRSLGRWEIIDALWADSPPPTAVNAVQVHVSALRKALGPGSVVIAGDGYRLGGEVAVDVAEFVAACRRGASELTRGQAGTAAQTLRQALELWRGPALAGLEAAPFLAVERTRLEEARLSVLEQRIEADLELGQHRAVVSELESLVARQPLREGLRALLMQALYRCGRQAEALAVYDVGRRLLQDELGLDPSPALRAVHQRVLSQVESVPVPSAVRPESRRELPALLDETVGRTEELAALAALLEDRHGRLVSLLGTGGVGKTRLAVEFGHHVADSTRDAVVFVPLGHAEKPADVPAAICQALGVRTGEDAVTSLESALRGSHTLLICDNFEHVADAAPLLPRLLAVAPDLQVLVTTRQPLGLRGERFFTLRPLAAAGASEQPSLAAQLFLARVRDYDPTYEPTEAEVDDIAEIAQRCDGLPLALELAAARTRALPVAELNRRLSDPLSLLAGGARDVPDRHRTLRASIGWSVGALTGDQARFLTQLTVFRGGFVLPAAAAAAGCDADEALAHVEALLDRSLIQRLPRTGGQHRFGMLETIREYAAELLDAEVFGDTQRRHAEYYRAWMRPLPEPTRTGASPSTWQAQLAEQANLRQAVRWALPAADGELAADLVVAAAWVWDQTGPQAELERWLEQVLERPDVSPGRRCDAYWWQATLSSSGDLSLMAAPIAAARSLAENHEDTRRLVWVEIISVLGEMLLHRPDEALQAVRQGQALSTGHPETTNLHVSILMLNRQLSTLGGEPIAAALRARQQALVSAGGTSVELRALILLHLSEVMLLKEDPWQAVRFAEEGVALAQRMDSGAGLADSRSQRGYANLLLGRETEAATDLRAAVAGRLQSGVSFFVARDLLRLAAAASVSAADGDADAGAAAVAVGVLAGSPELTADLVARPVVQRHLDALPARLPGRYDAAVAEGRELVAGLGTLAAMLAVLQRFATVATAGGISHLDPPSGTGD